MLRLLENVLCIAMPAKVHFALERTGTQVADKGLIPGMLSRMCNEVRRLGKGLATNLFFGIIEKWLDDPESTSRGRELT